MDNNNQEKGFVCTGDCMVCSNAQRQYCASLNSYKCMRMIAAIQTSIEEMRRQISALQDSEPVVFNPLSDETVTDCNPSEDNTEKQNFPIAQEG